MRLAFPLWLAALLSAPPALAQAEPEVVSVRPLSGTPGTVVRVRGRGLDAVLRGIAAISALWNYASGILFLPHVTCLVVVFRQSLGCAHCA